MPPYGSGPPRRAAGLERTPVLVEPWQPFRPAPAAVRGRAVAVRSAPALVEVDLAGAVVAPAAVVSAGAGRVAAGEAIAAAQAKPAAVGDPGRSGR